MGSKQKIGHGVRVTRGLVAGTVAGSLMAGILVTSAAPASARVQPVPANARMAPARPTAASGAQTAPPVAGPSTAVVDTSILTPAQLKKQITAAEALRSELMRSGAEVAAANSRLERLSAQANTLLAGLSVARTAQAAAEDEAATQKVRLAGLGTQVQGAYDGLGRLTTDTYIRGGGPLGEMVSILESLTSSSPDQSSNTLATVQYLVSSRARLFGRLRSLRSAQVTTAGRAGAASRRAGAAARSAAEAKSALDTVIADQRTALEGFKVAQADQLRRASELRGSLLRARESMAQAADRQLARALQSQDQRLQVSQSPSCGNGSGTYPNGRLPASALCPLYAAPGESLVRTAADAFNAMSQEYQRQAGSALCVTDGYRSFSEQVAVKLARPNLAASPGRSQHGLGLAVDLCGGVQSFASPAHLWMQRNAPLYGWFHPGWAEPTGSLPEPWHWEFAG